MDVLILPPCWVFSRRTPQRSTVFKLTRRTTTSWTVSFCPCKAVSWTTRRSDHRFSIYYMQTFCQTSRNIFESVRIVAPLSLKSLYVRPPMFPPMQSQVERRTPPVAQTVWTKPRPRIQRLYLWAARPRHCPPPEDTAGSFPPPSPSTG